MDVNIDNLNRLNELIGVHFHRKHVLVVEPEKNEKEEQSKTYQSETSDRHRFYHSDFYRHFRFFSRFCRFLQLFSHFVVVLRVVYL